MEWATRGVTVSPAIATDGASTFSAKKVRRPDTLLGLLNASTVLAQDNSKQIKRGQVEEREFILRIFFVMATADWVICADVIRHSDIFLSGAAQPHEEKDTFNRANIMYAWARADATVSLPGVRCCKD